jgi:hypothetical protein
MARQNEWRWCSKCEGFFFSGNPTQGVCPSGGAHDATQSGHYVALFGDVVPGAQDAWRWCQKCQGMFFAGNNTAGVCAAGGGHDASQSGHYVVPFGDAVPPSQSGWRWCRKCQGLFFGGNADAGRCPASGAHDGSVSGQYSVGWEIPRRTQITVASDTITLPAGTALGGWSTLILNPDGSYTFSAYFHDSGMLDYSVGLVCAVRSPVGEVFTFSLTGKVGGHTPWSGSSDLSSTISGTNSAISAAWDDLSAGCSARFVTTVGVDLQTTWNELKSLYGVIAEVVAVVGPLLA